METLWIAVSRGWLPLMGLLLFGGCQRKDAAPVAAMAMSAPAPVAAAEEGTPPAPIPEQSAASLETPSPEATATVESTATAFPPPPAAAVPDATEGTTPTESTTTPLLPAPPGGPPALDSLQHRQLFNRVAVEYYPLQWVRDVDDPHVINIAMEEVGIPAPLRGAFGLREGSWEETPALRKAIDLVQQELERRRVAALQSALSAQFPVIISEAPVLANDVQPLASALLQWGYGVQELAIRQEGLAAFDVMRTVYEQADPQAIQWLQRVGIPHCAPWSEDPYCSLLSTFPRFQPGTSDVMAERTVLGERLKTIAAREGLESSVRQYLEAVGNAMVGTDQGAWGAADVAWKAARGPIEIYVGGPAAPPGDWTFLVGVDHLPTNALIVALPELRQKIEADLKGIAPESYQPRQLSVGSYVRVIDVLLAAGSAKVSPWYTVAPEWLSSQVYADDGKRVVCANVLAGRVPLIAQLTKDVALTQHHAQVTPDAAIANAVLAQFAIDLGPRVDPTSALAYPLREALAETLAQWMIPMLVQEKVLMSDTAATMGVTHVMTLVHYLRQGPRDPRYHLAALQLTHLARQGALTREGERLHIDAAAIPRASLVLLRELARAAAQPDAAGRQALLQQYATLMPEPLQALLGQLSQLPLPRDVIFVYQPTLMP